MWLRLIHHEKLPQRNEEQLLGPATLTALPSKYCCRLLPRRLLAGVLSLFSSPITLPLIGFFSLVHVGSWHPAVRSSYWFQFSYFISLFFNSLPLGLCKADTCNLHNMEQLRSPLQGKPHRRVRVEHACSLSLSHTLCPPGVTVLGFRLLSHSAWTRTRERTYTSGFTWPSPIFNSTVEDFEHAYIWNSPSLFLKLGTCTIFKVLKACWPLIQKLPSGWRKAFWTSK